MTHLAALAVGSLWLIVMGLPGLALAQERASDATAPAHPLQMWRAPAPNPAIGWAITPPPEDATALREPIVLLRILPLGLREPSHPADVATAHPCGSEVDIRLHPRDAFEQLYLEPYERPLWFRVERPDSGPHRCVVTAAFTRRALQHHALLQVELRHTREDKVSFSSSVVIRVGPEQVARWQ